MVSYKRIVDYQKTLHFNQIYLETDYLSSWRERLWSGLNDWHLHDWLSRKTRWLVSVQSLDRIDGKSISEGNEYIVSRQIKPEILLSFWCAVCKISNFSTTGTKHGLEIKRCFNSCRHNHWDTIYWYTKNPYYFKYPGVRLYCIEMGSIKKLLWRDKVECICIPSTKSVRSK